MKYIINKFKIVSFMGGLFYTLVTIGLSLLSIFILGLITWLIVYIFEKG